MRRSAVRDPEDPSGGSVRLLTHNQVHQLVIGSDSGFSLTDPEQFTPVNIPSGNVGQRAFSFVFGLHTAGLIRHRTVSQGLSAACLDTGFFIGTDHIVIRPQRDSLEYPEIQIQDARRSFRKERVSGKDPTPVIPGLDRVTMQVTPYGLNAYGKYNASIRCLFGDIGMTETGQGEPQLGGEFTGRGFDLHNALRGKKTAVARILVGPPGRRRARNRSVYAIW